MPDERLPVPPELLSGLDPNVLCTSTWFPIIKDGDTIVIAANDPIDSQMLRKVKKHFPENNHEFRVAIGSDTAVLDTESTLFFLEGYQFVETKPAETNLKRTMLARIASSLPNCCVIIEPSLDNKVRSHLAHEMI